MALRIKCKVAVEPKTLDITDTGSLVELRIQQPWEFSGVKCFCLTKTLPIYLENDGKKLDKGTHSIQGHLFFKSSSRVREISEQLRRFRKIIRYFL